MEKNFLNDDSNHLIKEFKSRKRNNNFHFKIEIIEEKKKESSFSKIIELSNEEEEENIKENEMTFKDISLYSNKEILDYVLSKVPMLNIYKMNNKYYIRMYINKVLIQRQYIDLNECIIERNRILKELMKKNKKNFKEKLFKKYVISLNNKKN